MDYYYSITLIIAVNDIFRVRISNGSTRLSGVLEQQRNDGPWGGICVEQATFKEIQLICRHLGFEQPNYYMYAYENESNNPGMWNFIYFSEEEQQELQSEYLEGLTFRPPIFSECSHNRVLHIACQDGKQYTVKHPEYTQNSIWPPDLDTKVNNKEYNGINACNSTGRVKISDRDTCIK